MKNIKIYTKALFCFLLLISSSSKAQQVFISQDFENPATMDWTLNDIVPFLGTVSSVHNTFIVNDVYDGGNVLYDFVFIPIPNTADQGYQPNSNYLHTAAFDAINGNGGGLPAVLNSTYKDQVFNDIPELICAMTPDYSTIGFEGVDVSYWWYSIWSETEFGTEVYYSLDFGTTWTLIDGPLSADTTWQQSYIDMGNTLDNLPNVRFAFVFSNTLDNEFTNDLLPLQGFGLDDFRLIADCDFELPEDYTVCSGESTTIHADTTWYNTFSWSTGSAEDSVSLVINQDTTISITAVNEFCTIQDDITIFVQTERADLGLIVNGEVNGVGIPCYGDCNGELQLEVINGTPENDGSYTVQWMDSLMNPINNNVNNSVLNNFTSTLSDICEGKYYVSVLDANCTIPEMDSIFIFHGEELVDFEVEEITPAYCLNIPTGSVSLVSINDFDENSFSFNWSNGDTNSTLTNQVAGIYTVLIQKNNCIDTLVVEIPLVETFELQISSDSLNCYSDSSGSATVSSVGGFGPYTYDWNTSAGVISQQMSSASSNTILNLTQGITSVVVTDVNGCAKTTQINVDQPTELQYSVFKENDESYLCEIPVCDGQINVEVYGGVGIYTINCINSSNEIIATNQSESFSEFDLLCADFYQISVTDENGCSGTLGGSGLSLPVEIISGSPVTSSINTTAGSITNNILCYGDTAASLSVSNPNPSFTYDWYVNGELFTSGLNVVLPAGDIFVQAIASPYCYSNSDTISIFQPSQLTIVSDVQPSICNSNNGSLSFYAIGGFSPYSYSLSYNGYDIEGITDFTDLSAGIYSLTLFDANSCELKTDFEIENLSLLLQNNLLIYDASSIYNCDGVVISSPSGGFPPFSFNWNGSEGNNITTICSGNNILTITDSIGCELVDTFFVGPVSLGCIDYNACNFSEIANTDDGSCIYPDSIYDCFDNCYNDNDLDGVCDELEINGCTDENAPNFNELATDDDGSCIECNISVEYILYNSSNNIECNGLIGLIINNQVDYIAYVNNETLNTNYYTEACYGENIILIEDDLGCIYNDTINVGANTIYGCTDLQATNYNPEATNDDSSCEYEDCFQIETDSLLEILLPEQDIFCEGDTYIIDPIIINGVEPFYYDWGDFDNANFLEVNQPGSYTLTVTDSNGCSDSHNLELLEKASPQISYAPEEILVCSGIPVEVSAYGAQSYIWSPNISLSSDTGSTIEISTLSSITYTLEGVDSIGCSNSILVPITATNSFDLEVSTGPETCNGFNDGFIILNVENNAVPPINYSIDGGINYSSINEFYYLTNGTYQIAITDGIGCVLTQEVLLNSSNDFSIETSDIEVFCIEDSLTTLSVNSINQSFDFNGYEFSWFESNTWDIIGNNNTIDVNPGSFFLSVQDENGCTQTQNFLVNDSICEIIDPCDITPTGLFVDNIIHNRIVFNWSAPDAAPSHYMIRYREVGTSSWTVMTAGPVNTNEFTGTSRTRYFMEPGTTYQWNIRARVLNEDGSINCQSPWSASSQYTTLEACANLENLSASTEANWVTLSADAPDASWGVWQSKGKVRVVGTNSFRYLNGNANGDINVLKGNFTPSTDYEWHTKAWCTGNVDANGDSDPQYHSGWGDFSAFTTEAICDKMPTNLSTSANGAQTAITMSWSTPESGQPDHYFLELTNITTGQVWAWNNLAGSLTSKTKFGLTAGDYSWRIRGACGTNGTSWATIFSQPVEYTLGGARFDNDIVSDLNVYPNPSRDLFNISFSSDNLQSISIRVVNVIGEEIFKEELTDFGGTYTHELDMSKKSKGVYFLEISSEKGTLNSKMVLQ